jgi:hypothetical protein
MSDAERGDKLAPSSTPTKHGLWQFLKRGLTVGALGALGTVLVSLLQYQSAYQDKVATVAREDTAAATATFTDALNAMSVPILLQQRLIYDFYRAIPGDTYKNDEAYETADARNIYKSYADAYTNLNENYTLLARKVELYLDWPTNPLRESNLSAILSTDPVSLPLLGEFNFDCEGYMPTFENTNSHIALKDPQNTGRTLGIDWYSAKHHVLTTEYCFEVTHRTMTAVLQWASRSPINPADFKSFTEPDREQILRYIRPANQTLRLNAFMSLAMYNIELFRSMYQPHSLLCNLPFMHCR